MSLSGLRLPGCLRGTVDGIFESPQCRPCKSTSNRINKCTGNYLDNKIYVQVPFWQLGSQEGMLLCGLNPSPSPRHHEASKFLGWFCVTTSFLTAQLKLQTTTQGDNYLSASPSPSEITQTVPDFTITEKVHQSSSNTTQDQSRALHATDKELYKQVLNSAARKIKNHQDEYSNTN